jgi:hypothetical protein
VQYIIYDQSNTDYSADKINEPLTFKFKIEQKGKNGKNIFVLPDRNKNIVLKIIVAANQCRPRKTTAKYNTVINAPIAETINVTAGENAYHSHPAILLASRVHTLCNPV